MIRIEMLDEHESHAGVRRKSAEQLQECVESAGGGANTHDREVCAGFDLAGPRSRSETSFRFLSSFRRHRRTGLFAEPYSCAPPTGRETTRVFVLSDVAFCDGTPVSRFVVWEGAVNRDDERRIDAGGARVKVEESWTCTTFPHS